MEEGSSPPPEFLKKLEALKKRKAGMATDAGDSEPDIDAREGAEEAPAEVTKSHEVPRRKSIPPASEIDDLFEAERAREQSGEGTPPAEFLKKLEKLQKQKVSGTTAAAPTRDIGGSRPEPEENRGVYGIENVIELMRQLPADNRNLEMIMLVVKSTLQSFNVDLEKIISDAEAKQEAYHQRIMLLQQEAAHFDEEARRRLEEARRLERSLEEIVQVKTRLISGRELGRIGGSAATTSPPSIPGARSR